jgi:hypothetical protein
MTSIIDPILAYVSQGSGKIVGDYPNLVVAFLVHPLNFPYARPKALKALILLGSAHNFFAGK